MKSEIGMPIIIFKFRGSPHFSNISTPPHFDTIYHRIQFSAFNNADLNVSQLPRKILHGYARPSCQIPIRYTMSSVNKPPKPRVASQKFSTHSVRLYKVTLPQLSHVNSSCSSIIQTPEMNNYHAFPNCMDVVLINDSDEAEHLSTKAKVLHHRVCIFFLLSLRFTLNHLSSTHIFRTLVIFVYPGLLQIFGSKLVACRRITNVRLCRGSKFSSEILHLPTFGVQGDTGVWLFGPINNLFFLGLRWSCRGHSFNPPIFYSSPRKEGSNSF